MGFLDFFKPKKVRSHGAFELAENNGTFEPVEIVGESFQRESFKIIRDKLGMSSDSEAIVSVELRNEPNNPHANQGKAVAVFALGYKVGYVSSFTAVHVFDMLEKDNGSATLPGRIYFGDLRENPPKNSVSIEMSVQTKSVEETQKLQDQNQKNDELRAQREIERDEFLANPSWSNHELTAGDSVTFTGFSAWEDLPKLSESILGAKSKNGVHLLVVHPSIASNSAKLRDWLAKKKPAADLKTFVENNPSFAAYYNASTREFVVPAKISGNKPVVSAPPATRVFESDEGVGVPVKKMPSDLVFLPEQTLATYPTFTIYGSVNWRLSDLKVYKVNIDRLFSQIGGGKTDGLIVSGDLVKVEIEGVTRLEFQHLNVGLGLVPKNETESLMRDGKSWQGNSVLGLFTLDFKNNLKGTHDAGLNEKYFLK
jgi:hypothetical protein